jgi:hypothetical protein
MGWRPRTGRAILVVVRGPASSPAVLTRRQVELVHGEKLPGHAYHAAQQQELSPRAARALVERVERAATKAAVDAMQPVVDEFGVEAAGVVCKPRNLPSDLQRILASHALLHAAEGALFERALVEAAAEVGIPARVSDPDTLEISDALDAMGKSIGAPWQKDHKLAAAAALAALRR